jgi:integrase/recombinase XerC
MLQAYETEVLTASGAAAVHHRMIRNWMGEMLEEGLAKRTLARKVASLSTWYKFLMREGLVKANPASRVKPPKFEKRLPSFLKDDSIDHLFEGEIFSEDFEGLRDKALFEVLYSCGLRRSELVGLQAADIDFSASTLKVLGKGRKERVVPFGSMASRAMKAYVRARENKGFGTSGAFFLTEKGEPIYTRLVNRIVEKYLKQVCSLKKKSPHVLRHTFATHLLDRGADLNAIKELLGHASLAATQVYTHNSISKLKDVYNQAHPKA